MEQFALLDKGKSVGEVGVKEEGLYLGFHAQWYHMAEGLHWVYVLGENGSMRLGVLERQGAHGVLQRRLSKQMLRPVGKIQGFQLGEASLEIPWEPILPGELWWNKLSAISGSKTKQVGAKRLLAVAYQPQKPFPLMNFFCFCKPTTIGQSLYLVLTVEGDDIACIEV